ncbi:MAG: DUF167 domain-containing protein [Nitrospinota bacterium]
MPGGEGPSFIQETPDGVILRVRVHPRASKVSVGPPQEAFLPVRLTAPPVDQAANRQCVKALAERLGVRPRQVAILSGQKGREKRVRVEGVDARRVRATLGG